jgi:hypothetical protein
VTEELLEDAETTYVNYLAIKELEEVEIISFANTTWQKWGEYLT